MEEMLLIPFILIPYSNEEELPTITINGQKVRVRGHSSVLATYAFIPQELYDENVEGFRKWQAGVTKYIEKIVVHEIGARCGKR